MDDITYGGQGTVGGERPVAAQPLGTQASKQMPGAISSGGVVSANAAKKETKIFKIGLIIAIVAIVGLVIGLIVLVVQLTQAEANIDARIADATAVAREAQRQESDLYWADQINRPFAQFNGPADYGTLRFDHPRTWSVHVAKDAARGGDFEAYLNPISVPPISTSGNYALRVFIINKAYDDVLKTYEQLINRGELVSSFMTIERPEGRPTVPVTRLTGMFTRTQKATAIFFKLRDKTVMVRTDGDLYLTYFDEIIKTIDFYD